MAVRAVAVFHVRPGKYGQLFEALNVVKKSVVRGGGTFVASRQVFGPQPGSVVAVGRYADWAMFAKVRSDAEFEKVSREYAQHPDPPAGVVTRGHEFCSLLCAL
jgi:hypothetical protein